MVRQYGTDRALFHLAQDPLPLALRVAPMASKPSADPASALLPQSYDTFRNLQTEFQRYQDAAFPIRSSRFFALELAGETGELANLEKKVWKGRSVADRDFQDEAADVCIALINFANSRGIDLAKAVEEKMRRIDRRRLEDPETETGGSAAD